MDRFKVPIKPLGPGLSTEQIRSAEAALAQPIPEAYRQVLRLTNGCYLTGCVFFRPRSPEHPQGMAYDVRYLMGVGHVKPLHDLVAHHRDHGDRVPAGSFEFARDSGGNSFIVFTEGPRSGEVAFRDHEGPFQITTVAASMDEFFERLVPDDLPEVLAAFPPVVGAAVKITRPAKKEPAAKKIAPKRAPAAKKKGAAKKTAAKGRTATRRG
jgi:hypothetical protein